MHIAQKESMKYLYEHIFRSVQKHLSDSAANDFTFLEIHYHNNIISVKSKVLKKINFLGCKDPGLKVRPLKERGAFRKTVFSKSRDTQISEHRFGQHLEI